MANLVNLDAEVNADLIGDDAQPALRLQVIGSTGPGLRSYGLVNTSTASIDVLNLAGQIIETNSATTGVLVRNGAVGNMSIGVLRVQGNSVASGAVLEFTQKGFVSITSVILTTVANTDYAIRVQVGLETRWIPLFKDAAIFGAAAFT